MPGFNSDESDDIGFSQDEFSAFSNISLNQVFGDIEEGAIEDDGPTSDVEASVGSSRSAFNDLENSLINSLDLEDLAETIQETASAISINITYDPPERWSKEDKHDYQNCSVVTRMSDDGFWENLFGA